VNRATAQQSIVDQSATPLDAGPVGYGMGPIGPGVGQSFTPVLNSLDFVEVLMDTMTTPAYTTVHVRIHEQSITGNVIGESLQLLVTSDHPSTGNPVLAHFSFPNSVPLVPGQTYVLEIPGTSFWEWGVVVGPSSYEGGRAITLGPNEWFSTDDLWFREGVVAVPEPNIWQLAASALLFVTLKRIWTWKHDGSLSSRHDEPQ
jgi:hypothetical protein